jgi:hypothetical protein
MARQARAFNEKHKRLRTAVHDRDFRAVDLNDRVVDPATGKRRHKMFDRADLRARFISKRRRHPGVDYILPVRCDNSIVAGQVRPAKYNPGIRLRGAKGHGHLAPGVKTDAGAADRRFQGFLADCVQV